MAGVVRDSALIRTYGDFVSTFVVVPMLQVLLPVSGILAGVLTSGLSARNITRPLASSEYSKLVSF